MTSMTKDGLTFYFEYDEEGRRIREIKNGLVTNYYYSGDQLIAEVSEECLAVYLYDESGSPIGYQYHEPSFGEDVFVTFFFEKNLQGDVVAVYTENGTLVTTYEYDAWGNYIETFYNESVYPYETHSPISYRGCYYDKEYGFYCLGTRFYDPVTRRFISADTSAVLTATPTALTDKNLYAYCDNNPVMRTDASGDFWNWLVGGVVGAVGGAITASMNGKTGKEFWGSVANGVISGVVSGLAVDVILVTGGSAAVVVAAGAASGAIGSGMGSIAEDLISGDKINWRDVGIDSAFGAASGALFGAISGPQNSMMDDVTSRAGSKMLKKGISVGYAVKKTSARELRKIGSSFVEECLSNFTSWFAQKSFESMSLW